MRTWPVRGIYAKHPNFLCKCDSHKTMDNYINKFVIKEYLKARSKINVHSLNDLSPFTPIKLGLLKQSVKALPKNGKSISSTISRIVRSKVGGIQIL